MTGQFPWKRFWCRREAGFTLGDRGFLTDPEGKYGDILNPQLTTLDQLQTVRCLALLGEPGVGKSWSISADVSAFLKETPELEVIRLDLRSFGSEDRLYRALFEHPAFRRWANGQNELHVYLDSFDECLLRIETVAALLADELRKYQLDRLKLRIACRTAAWPPLLERALRAGYGDDHFTATELVPLRRADVLGAAALSGITKPEAFLERVDQLELAPLACKPITLKFLLETFQREGDLPTDLISLYEKGCLILCEEQNESRRAAGRTGVC
jgi:predicted NACHT family NTPase